MLNALIKAIDNDCVLNPSTNLTFILSVFAAEPFFEHAFLDTNENSADQPGIDGDHDPRRSCAEQHG